MALKRLDLAGTTCVVTSGARGIGAALGRELHARGACVALLDTDLEEAEAVAASLGDDRVLVLRADVTEPGSLREALGRTREQFGPVAVVCANAGIAAGAHAFTIDSAPDGLFERIIDVNLRGVWNTIRATREDVVNTKGHVLITASMYAYVNGMINAPYAASKAAVEQLGRALRTELSYCGASAGVLFPAWIRTDISKVAFGDDEVATGLVARAMPGKLGARVEPAELARIAVDGIERRRSRTHVPGFFGVYSTLRGIVNPLTDFAFARDRVMQAGIRRIDERAGTGNERNCP